MNRLISAFTRIFRFYYDGFSSMSWWGRRVWTIIIIKLIIIFIVLKIFFFPDFLHRKYKTEEQKSKYVMEQLTKSI